MPESVIICIPTFKRPKMLARLLDAVAQLQTTADVSVIVADNDAENHAGMDLCRQMPNYRWPLKAVIAEKRGIAAELCDALDCYSLARLLVCSQENIRICTPIVNVRL